MNGNPYSRGYLTWALVVLSLANVLNYVDRNVINILLEPIKRDLSLTDSQAGLLTGLAFTVVYSIMGVPLARLADRGWNVRVLSAAIAGFSIMTVLCGSAASFAMLLLARMGVGIGEAGAYPTSQSLIASYFSPQTRARAFSVLAISGGIGTLLGMALGGYINDHHGWRFAFLVMGVPGIAVALLAYFTLREPVRAPATASAPAVSLRQAARALGSRRSYVWMVTGLAICAIGAYGIATWTPAFFMRNYDMSATKIGATMAIGAGPGTILGIFLGGYLADRLSRRDARWPLWLFMVSFGGIVPVYLLLFLSYSEMLGLVMVVPATVLACIWIAPGMALGQALAGSQYRATAAAIFGLAVNLVGLGIGPLAVGVISDLLLPIAGAEALRYSLCSMLTTFVVGLVFFMLATRYVREDLETLQRTETPAGR